MANIAPLDFSKLSTYSLFSRPSKVGIDSFARPLGPGASLRDFIKSLPDQLLGHDFPELVERLARAHENKKSIIIGMGAHVIKVGLNPVIIDLMRRGIVTGLALNGAGIVHDTELALAGKTSEDVAAVIGDGSFGAAKETGETVNQGIGFAAENKLGIGAGLGQYLLDHDFPYNRMSLLANARELGVPLTVHVAMGTDIVHIHPAADGAAIGAAGHLDFRIFSALVANLSGGAYLNTGSAVLLPEVFLKALTVARNLGYKVNEFTTANFDFIRQYRPMTNVVARPVAAGGKGYNITGHHELMIPLLAAALIDRISGEE